MARKTVERNISFDDKRKLYYVSMDLGRDENGKRIKQYRTYPTLAAARNGLRDFHTLQEQEREKEQEERYKVRPAQEMDLSHWLEYWMDSIVRPNRAETTVYSYQKIIDNHIDPALGEVPLRKLSPNMIQQYYADTQRATGLSSNTMRRHHDLLSSALRSAVRQEVLAVSPMERVEPPRVRSIESHFYDQQELKLLYQKIEGQLLELPVKMAGSLGMRREEICGLKWECVDFQRHLVIIREARTAYGATIVQKETKNWGPSSIPVSMWSWIRGGSPTPPTRSPWPLPGLSGKTTCPGSPSTASGTPLPPLPPVKGPRSLTLERPWATPRPPPPDEFIPIWWTGPTRSWYSGCRTP